MTAGEVCLLRNSILWMGLFDPSHERSLAELLALLRTRASEQFGLLEFEALCVRYLSSLRDERNEIADDCLATLERHPLWKSKELGFASIVNFARGKKESLAHPLERLGRSLRSTVFPLSHARKSRIVVDLVEGKISGGKKTQHSLAMALALHLLRTAGSATVEEFSHICFGLRRFDAIIHMPKVYNLLARMKSLSTALEFRVRSGFVIAEGSWNEFVFIRDNQLTKQLSRQPEWKHFLLSHSQRTNQVVEKPLPEKLSWNGFKRRGELEVLIGRPRSTTNRILARLIQNGVIVRDGAARNARYRMKRLGEINLEETL